MTIVPAASMVQGNATQSRPPVVARPCEVSLDSKPTASWLVVEDEYFPFDADSFEER